MKRLRTAARWRGQALHPRSAGRPRCQSSAAAAAAAADIESRDEPPPPPSSPRPLLPSPPPDRALRSAKLAALHARLALPNKIPLQTLARALVTPSADPGANFNNANLAFLGGTIINYHVLEHLVCKWPRLPMAILYESLRAYAGTEALQQVARRWGVEDAAAPGEEVDPGLLQWRAEIEGGKQQQQQQQQQQTTPPTTTTTPPTQAALGTRWGYVRAEADRGPAWRRGLSSRIVLDDDFGDVVRRPSSADLERAQLRDEAFESLVQAVVGAAYAHCGRDAAKALVASHILARSFDPSVLFSFHLPTRELAMLCAREGFEPPIARLESETGRLSRTPVYVVGIYSGAEKLGEGAGPSLDMARRKASMASLKAWYLYSPGGKVRVPSDMLDKGAKPWKAPHIDLGEII